MRRLRVFARWQGLLVLALFLAWTGASATHQHTDNPSCQICKLLQSGAADLAAPAMAPTPDATGERVARAPSDTPGDPSLPLLKVRGPPLA